MMQFSYILCIVVCLYSAKSQVMNISFRLTAHIFMSYKSLQSLRLFILYVFQVKEKWQLWQENNG